METPDIELKYINDDWFQVNVDGTTVLDGHKPTFEGVQAALRKYKGVTLAAIKVHRVWICENCAAEFKKERYLMTHVCLE